MCIESLESMRETNGSFLTRFHTDLDSPPAGSYMGNPIKFTTRRGQDGQLELFRVLCEKVLTSLVANLRRFLRVDLLDAMQVNKSLH